MAHLTDGTLRRKFDEPDSLTESENRHYSACAECQSRYATLADDARVVAGALAVPAINVDVASAFSRVRSAPAQPRFGIRLPIYRPTSRPVMGMLAAATVVFALVVTAVAQGVFFQPQTVQVVPVSVADLQSLSGLGDFGTFAWTTKPTPQLVASATEAATVSGLHVPAATVPSTVTANTSYAAMPAAVGKFTFDAAKAQAAAAKAGKTLPKMPAGMDGSTLTVTVGPAVIEIYGNLGAGAGTDASQLTLPQLVVGASSAPVVTSSGVSTQEFENYMLSLPGVSPKLAAAIRAVKDPSTTLPIPIPIEYATPTNVTVQDVTGVAVGDNTGLGAGVIWIKGGTVYGVAGTLKQDAILEIANGLK
jgi:hypothetical protein